MSKICSPSLAFYSKEYTLIWVVALRCEALLLSLLELLKSLRFSRWAIVHVILLDITTCLRMRGKLYHICISGSVYQFTVCFNVLGLLHWLHWWMIFYAIVRENTYKIHVVYIRAILFAVPWYLVVDVYICKYERAAITIYNVQCTCVMCKHCAYHRNIYIYVWYANLDSLQTRRTLARYGEWYHK